MKARTGLKARLSYWAVRFVALVLQAFPIDLNLRTARFLGLMWWHIDKRHRRLAFDHLRAAFGNSFDEKKLEQLSLRCFQHWTMYAVEFMCAFRLLDEWRWPRYIEPVEVAETLELLLEKKGAILLTGHYGNFELTAFMLAAIGFDVVAVMRPLDNTFLNDFVVRTRASRHLRLLTKKSVSTEAEEILKNGGAIGFVADQDAGRKGIFVDFFGQKASTYKSIALLAIHCDTPIVVGFARRKGKEFKYEGRVQRIIRPEEWRNRDDPVRWITQEYTTAIEEMVRDAPEQYLWIHRRWKSKPRDQRSDQEKSLARSPQVSL